MVDNVLVPQQERLQAALEQLAENIAQNRQNLETETAQRGNEHEDFEAAVQEHNDALEAIDECLALLAQLDHVSLAQVKKIQSNLGRLQSKLQNHNSFAPMVKALVALATEAHFANPEAVQEVLDKLILYRSLELSTT
jgi:chromosome segregation ATPase